MFRDVFKRKPAWETFAESAYRVSGLMLRKLDEGRQAGTVTERAVPLYHSLIVGSASLLRVIISSSPFCEQLTKVGFGDGNASLAGYLLLQCQRMWELYRAFNADPAIEKLIGNDFPQFALAFNTILGLHHEMLVSTLESANKVYIELGDGVDFRPVMDMQTFDLMQTVTDGRFLPEHWQEMEIGSLIAATGDIQIKRFRLIKAAKEKMGLPGPVF